MAKNYTETNWYTILFAAIMVLVVGVGLAALAQYTKPAIDKNKKTEKQMDILSSLGVKADKKNAAEVYKKTITKAIVLDNDGQMMEGEEAFNIDLAKELKKDPKDQKYPLYEAKIDGKTLYVIPLYGKGLWDAIWGYMAVSEDLISQGATFDHKGETPGLGAEIKQDFFKEDFEGEHLMKGDEFVGITTSKTNGDPKNEDKEDNEVDAIAGATITSDGVSAMIKERIAHYIGFIKNKKS